MEKADNFTRESSYLLFMEDDCHLNVTLQFTFKTLAITYTILYTNDWPLIFKFHVTVLKKRKTKIFFT